MYCNFSGLLLIRIFVVLFRLARQIKAKEAKEQGVGNIFGLQSNVDSIVGFISESCSLSRTFFRTCYAMSGYFAIQVHAVDGRIGLYEIVGADRGNIFQ